MAQYFLRLPKMGESVAEATLTKWLKEVGDTIAMDESIVGIATDKVDSDVPSEVNGILIEKRFQEDDVVQVGDIMAVIETSEEVSNVEKLDSEAEPETVQSQEEIAEETVKLEETISHEIQRVQDFISTPTTVDNRFYSPLVRSIAKSEEVSKEELQHITGTGKNNRVTKNDILEYIKHRNSKVQSASKSETLPPTEMSTNPPAKKIVFTGSGEDQIVEMTRMGKLTSEHMLMSKRTSAHVQSFVEADVTTLWNWREKAKEVFAARKNEKLTFTPLFIMAVIKALRDFPILNSSVSGDKIIQKKNINIGMATALDNGNLIVPVIKDADHLNLLGLTKVVNDLATRARSNSLKPDEVQGGTYTITNVGNFGSIMGTPIINQPQLGILAVGAIRKMPSVIETPKGDFIGIRRKLILSHSYDHRIINGATGGQFVKNVADYLESWDEELSF